MKKVFAFVFALFTLVSCSNDDEKKSGNNPDPSLTLLKRSIGTFYDENEVIICDYEYEGNRLTKITFSNNPYYPEGSYELYHYTNNLLTSTEFFIAHEITEKKIFEYNSNDRLISFIRETVDLEIAEKTAFIYNANETISIKQYTLYIDESDSFEEINATGILTLNNGNITKYELTSTTGENITQNYTFDTFNSPFKNVFANEIIVLSSLEGGANNMLSYNLIQNNQEQFSNSITLHYNPAGYPTDETETGLKREYIYY